MNHTKLYRYSFNIYRIENLIRNISLGLALYNAVNHNIIAITSFFLSGLIAQLHPITLGYVNSHANQTFYQYLSKKHDRFQVKRQKLMEKTTNTQQTEINIQINSDLLDDLKEIKFMEMINK